MPKKKSLSSVEAQELLEPVSEAANSPSEDMPDTASGTHLLGDTEALTTSGQPDFDVENEHSVAAFEDMPDMKTAEDSNYKDFFQELENAAAQILNRFYRSTKVLIHLTPLSLRQKQTL